MKRLTKSLAIGTIGLFALSGCASGSGSDSGDEFPAQDIRLTVPWAAGGSGDLTARTIAPLLERELGVEVIVENRPGANGSVAYNWLKDQKPDGYNLSMMGVEVATLQFQDYDIDPANYEPIGQGLAGPGAIAVPVDSPFETLEDLIEAAKASPGDITYSSPGVGSVWDSPAQGLQELAGITLTSVPFDGSAPAVAAVAAGDADFSIDAIGTQKTQVDAGKLRYLAMLTDERDPKNPDVPTAKESGIDLTNASWVGIMAPAGTPAETVQRLSEAMGKAVEDPEYRTVIENSNLVPTFKDSEEMKSFLEAEADRYGPWIALAQGK
ncbi:MULTISPECIES: Bug family tripartite tricarboxylate transporter substrate binding protein [Arthrobacter]|uniref:Tripartite tricarboxylate transporter substrate binding protein n=1 Tax=Arthrobacter caoxuetaonis TaxID=2886935 RepID=A0A9X1MDH9_9MICC|nr:MULTISPECIES: tripartite tricarboxylate transporter substrate binding protein [Arthrobacter]MCC3284014.1 tripartite tricarboxylate transporter substrate binding protein [Arthrobacter caoxuetaonis]MCC3296992.1 tripartite tricarboxylate transporter substrate binding protein [Arthrobacter caoxuetaonis]MCC9193879.1 tripartite tricarboxylate transporter substrate binding protein [Arthrobacter sp. zg-Y916]USQ58436.1 tripartite tricarboxylate transporter substrate binding protein [Arthrobacter caox